MKLLRRRRRRRPRCLRSALARSRWLGLAAISTACVVVACGPGCRTVVTTPRPSAPPPSRLDRVVAAMDREDWGEAERLLEPLLPPIAPGREG